MRMSVNYEYKSRNARRMSFDRSTLVLLLSNALAMVFALLQHWRLADMMRIYWGQSLIIGYYNWRRIRDLERFSTEGFTMNGRPVPPTTAAQRMVANFFALHYGFFHLIYFVFLRAQHPGSTPSGLLGTSVCILGFWFNHHFSYRYNREKDRQQIPNIGAVMFFPYARILPMHLTIIFGSLLAGGPAAILLFLGLKTAADLLMHQVQHREGQRPGLSGGEPEALPGRETVTIPPGPGFTAEAAPSTETPRNALIFGGTRYFGKRLAAALLERGVAVAIATRGRREVPFGDRVERFVLDRRDKESMARALGGRAWDVVYDQQCYAPTDAADACEVLTGRTSRYIFTSSQAVYIAGLGPVVAEEDFDPYHYGPRLGRRADFSYAEGKRLAETIFFQTAGFPVTAARFPIVLGPDDYTGRLAGLIGEIQAGRPVKVTNPDAAMSLISSCEAADFLAWLAGQKMVGPVNAASEGQITTGGLIALIEEAIGRKAAIVPGAPDDPFALTAPAATQTLDTVKARRAGYVFQDLREWLVPLIGEMARAEGRF